MIYKTLTTVVICAVLAFHMHTTWIQTKKTKSAFGTGSYDGLVTGDIDRYDVPTNSKETEKTKMDGGQTDDGKTDDTEREEYTNR